MWTIWDSISAKQGYSPSHICPSVFDNTYFSTLFKEITESFLMFSFLYLHKSKIYFICILESLLKLTMLYNTYFALLILLNSFYGCECDSGSPQQFVISQV